MPVNHHKNIIEIKNLSFAYSGELVLKNISLNIHEGDYLGIIGPNGSGKSTLLKLMLGLLKPSAGEVNLFGKPVSEFKDWYKLGYVSQKAVNFDPLFPVTVWEVVAMGRLGRRGLGKNLSDVDDKAIDKALVEVGMTEFRDRLIGDLSGGQQQRVFIARALAAEPAVIFLDEPTTGIDVETQEQFYSLLTKLNRERDLTLVLISHDIDVIAHEATELACINQTLVYHGEPKEFVKADYLEMLYGKNIRQILHGH
ncbi:MAG: metal ABC transporter ATP-binding protein [Patescibacteria group bacterium]|jgi:zinc transport system ATP-binding protein